MFSIKKLKPYIKQFWDRADVLMLFICVVCSVFGTIMIYRASSSMVAAGWEMNTNKQIIVQVFSIFLGVGAYVLLTVIDADLLASQWKFLVAIQVLLLVALRILGEDDGTGNRAWIRFAGIGIQPSEIIKIIYIIVAARQMTWLKEYRDINSFYSVLQMAGHFVLVFGAIVVVSSDLGSASIILCIFLTMFFALGVRLYWFALGGAAISAMVPLLWEFFLKPYQKNRLLAPYDPSIDPNNDKINWQTYQSKVTLASGRTTGVDAEHRYTAFTGKHTDFIFSCIGEELGMIGCIIVLILLTILIIRCVRIGLKAGRTFDMLLCIGVASAMTFQMFINIGMCLGVTPVIGITLPFFSYGGSSMVTMFAALGLVSGVKYKLKPKLFSIY
ncbi:MAG: FtsW/RodA/SpoVE family cell cycle protein [Oscillospiraceae bacterium]|nr:FtsW/RodA/SpoVE family cell cycle protein [Oscillospiraceae bacterium]